MNNEGWKTVTFVFEPRETELFRVKTNRGFEITASAEHKFIDGDLTLKPLDEFSEDEEVMMIRKLPTETDIKTDGYIGLQHTDYQRSEYNNSNRLREITQPEYLDTDFAYWLGAMAGDGSIFLTKKSATFDITFNNTPTDQLILNKVDELIERLFGVKATRKPGDGNCTKLQFDSKTLELFLRTNNIAKHKSYDAKIPELVAKSNDLVLAAFIAGLFDADGSITKKKAYRISTVSEQLVEDVMLSLLKLGIVSHDHIEDRTELGWRNLHQINILGQDSQTNLLNTIGKYSIKMQTNPVLVKRDCAITPYTPEGLSMTNYAGYVGYRNQRISMKTMGLINRDHGTNYDNTIFVDTLKSIESVGRHLAYDIEVEGTHKFNAGGFYVSNSGRRGALMLSISVEHPDVEEFIEIKKDLTHVNHANISVRITDAFMKAVENDEDFLLHFKNEKVEVNKTVRAKEVWNKLIKAAWQSAEPGLLFWDTIKRMSTTEYNGMEVVGTNPCSEEPLGAYDDCCLGSVNLSAFVDQPFTSNARLKFDELNLAFSYATRFLDDVLDYSQDKFPLPQEREASMRGRRIGVGATGLGDALIKLGMKYDEGSTVEFVDKLFDQIKRDVYSTSIKLAKEKGVFPVYDQEKHMRQPFIVSLPNDIKEEIKKFGLRNSAILTIPPVGSGSIIAGSSSGIEPNFAFSYKRRSHSLSQGVFEVKQPILQEYKNAGGDLEHLPSYFVTAHQIKPELRVSMQSVIQKHIDTAISSTINLPEDISVEAVGQIYLNAWRMGLKGVTVYREGSREGILETENVGKKPMKDIKLDAIGDFARPKILEGKTIKLSLVQGSLYLTLNGNGHPKEVFITLGKHGMEAKADAEAIGRLISMYLQSGGTVENVIASLKGIQGGQISWSEGTKLLSIPDAIAKALGVLTGQPTVGLRPPVSGVGGHVANVEVSEPTKYDVCPECHEQSLAESNGCRVCYSCSYFKCG